MSYDSHPNAEILSRLMANIKAHSGHWIAIGDWNVAPEELLASHILSELQAYPIVTGKATCDSGNELDYCVCSSKLRSLASLSADWTAPHRLHSGLILTCDMMGGQCKVFQLPAYADLPEDALISKRFGVQQGHKLRPIDDLSQSLINMAFESHGKVHVHDADVITAALLMFRRLHKGKVFGKTLDLKAAYRQLPLEERALDKAFIAVKCPETGEVVFFRLLCLPFGATAAVHSFIRVSLALCHIGNVLFRLPMTAYYDDFTLFSSEELRNSTSTTVDIMFSLLGFDFDRDGDKAQDLHTTFRALGVKTQKKDFKMQWKGSRKSSSRIHSPPNCGRKCAVVWVS